MGRDWLKQVTQGPDEPRTLRGVCSAGSITGSSGEQILSDLSNQVRLANVRSLLGAPMITPFDVFPRLPRPRTNASPPRSSSCRRRSSWPRSPSPRRKDIQSYYDQYKDVLPAPDRATPGFKIPRQIQVEILSIDGNALARSIKDKLTEQELRAAYENRKSEFEKRSNPERGRPADGHLRRPARADPSHDQPVR